MLGTCQTKQGEKKKEDIKKEKEEGGKHRENFQSFSRERVREGEDRERGRDGEKRERKMGGGHMEWVCLTSSVSSLLYRGIDGAGAA